MKKLVLLVLAFAVLSCSGNTPTEPSFSAAIQEAQDAAFEVTRAGGTSVGVALVTRDRGGLAGGYGIAVAYRALESCAQRQ